MSQLPAVTGKQLIKILESQGNAQPLAIHDPVDRVTYDACLCAAFEVAASETFAE